MRAVTIAAVVALAACCAARQEPADVTSARRLLEDAPGPWVSRSGQAGLFPPAPLGCTARSSLQISPRAAPGCRRAAGGGCRPPALARASRRCRRPGHSNRSAGMRGGRCTHDAYVLGFCGSRACCLDRVSIELGLRQRQRSPGLPQLPAPTHRWRPMSCWSAATPSASRWRRPRAQSSLRCSRPPEPRTTPAREAARKAAGAAA